MKRSSRVGDVRAQLCKETAAPYKGGAAVKVARSLSARARVYFVEGASKAHRLPAQNLFSQGSSGQSPSWSLPRGDGPQERVHHAHDRGAGAAPPGRGDARSRLLVGAVRGGGGGTGLGGRRARFA